MADQATLHDARRTYRFWIDDALIDTYGPRIGAYGIAVYALLARHARQGQAFPSHKHMRTQLALSESTIVRTLKLLEKEGLLTKEPRQSAAGDFTSNLYTLIHLKHEEEPVSQAGGGISQTGGGISQTGPPISQNPPILLKDSQRRILTEGKEEDNPSSVSLRSTASPLREKPTRTRQRTAASKCCPADWQPSPETEAWAAEKFPHINVLDALEAMKDYEFRTPHSDWDKTLRTWIRRSVGHRHGVPQETPAQRAGLTEKEYRTLRNMNNSVKHHQQQMEDSAHGGAGVFALLSGPKCIGPGV